MHKIHAVLSMKTERLAASIVDASYTVHREMGPGLLESICEECLCHELSLRDIAFDRQTPVPLTYKGKKLPGTLRLDLLVEDQIILELKCTNSIEPAHQAQLLSYMRLTSKRLGFLLNFHVPYMKDGIRRLIL